jgi:hypothetical protein
LIEENGMFPDMREHRWGDKSSICPFLDKRKKSK